MSKKKTLKDIADELGLSTSTVHRAIKGYGRVNEKTKEIILKKAEELGYQVNLAASALSSEKGLRLGIIYPDTSFYNEVARGASDAERELSVYGLTVEHITTQSYCPIQQSEVLRNIIEATEKAYALEGEKTYDGIGIAPAHPLLLNPHLQHIEKSGTKIVTFNNDAPESGRSCFIGQNPYIAAKTAAQIYASILPKGSSIALMSSFVSALGMIKRIEGFYDGAQEAGLNVVGPFEYSDNIASAYEMSKQVILANKIDAIYSNSMYGTIGCAKAIEDTGNSGNIIMVGYDLDEEIVKMIKKGTIYASIYQSPYLQGYYTVKTLYELCARKNQELGGGDSKHNYKYIKSFIIIKSNLEEFLKEEYL